jgi:hypothetical protein
MLSSSFISRLQAETLRGAGQLKWWYKGSPFRLASGKNGGTARLPVPDSIKLYR